MNPPSLLRTAARWIAASAGLAAAAYSAYVGVTWYRYGDAAPPRPDEQDALLDRFMPAYEIVERHHVHVAAPAAITLAAACEMDLQGSRVVRTIISARESILGAVPDHRPRPPGLLVEMQSLGWGVLANVPGREVVMGAVTRPWEANVTFRAVEPAQFAAFSEPGYVKIAWTLRADRMGPTASLFRTETRAIATDPTARARFRKYWSLLSPGIILIRFAILGPLKAEAERRHNGGRVSQRPDDGGSGAGESSGRPLLSGLVNLPVRKRADCGALGDMHQSREREAGGAEGKETHHGHDAEEECVFHRSIRP